MLTEKIHLTEGIAIAGKRYRDVVVRAAIIQDTLDIEKESKDQGIVYMSLALLVKSIVELGNTDKDGAFIERAAREDMSVDALGTLNETDLERLQVARDYLKKKQQWRKES